MGRIISLEKMQNLRDLGGETGHGGRKVISSKLYRAGRPADASERDLFALGALGIDLLIDLRTPDETVSAPDPAIDGVRNILLPVSRNPVKGEDIYSSDSLPVREKMKLMYRDIILGDVSSKAIADVLEAVLGNASGITLFHCTAGKDRTGIVCALIYELLGVSREDIIKDYMLTNICLKDFADELYDRISEGMSVSVRPYDYRENFYDSMLVRKEYIMAMYDAIEEVYGTPERYLESIGPGLRPEFRKAFLD